MRDSAKAIVVVAPSYLMAYQLLVRAEACHYFRRIFTQRPSPHEPLKQLHVFYHRDWPMAHVADPDQWLTTPANQLHLSAMQALDYFSNDKVFVRNDIDCTIPET